MNTAKKESAEASVGEVWFYHLVRADMEKVLPDLLEKTLGRGWRAVVRVADSEQADYWNAQLWTYNPSSFLPHGTAKDGYSEKQPVYLTAGDENPNGANVLFLTSGVFQNDISAYERCILLFQDRDAQAVEGARAYWKQKKSEGFTVKYWQQSNNGKWELTASDSA